MFDLKTIRTRVLMSAASLTMLAAISAAGGTAIPKAQLISVMTDDKVPLFGLLYSPEAATHSIVIHVPGGPGAFYSAQDMTPLAASLNSHGVAFLTINMRTAGNMEYARFEDYLLDIAAAIRYAKQGGMTNIVLLGHSLGSARVVYYLSQSKEPTVKALVLSGVITSPYLEAQLRWNEAERTKYDTFLQTQREHVLAGRPRQLASYPWNGARELELSAGTWLNLFGPPAESNASTIKFAKDISVPVLIIHGTKDEAAMLGNAEQLKAALTASPASQLIVVDGANHLFIGQADKYAEIVTNWVLPRIASAAVTTP